MLFLISICKKFQVFGNRKKKYSLIFSKLPKKISDRVYKISKKFLKRKLFLYQFVNLWFLETEIRFSKVLKQIFGKIYKIREKTHAFFYTNL